MKKVLSIFFLLASLFCSCQNVNSSEEIYPKINLIGIWVVTNYDNPNTFKDYWEFKSDGTFNELKYKTEGGDNSLTQDENGSWILNKNHLNITVTQEEHNGKQVLYEEIQSLEFLIFTEGKDYILHIQSKVESDKGKITKLRLSKKI